MVRAAHSGWLSGRHQSLTLGPRRALIAAALVLAFVTAALFWTRWGSRGRAQIEQLPDADRRALYDRTLADLRLCATAEGFALREHCSHQAELILSFSECDAACRELASPWQARPTR
jgi:hypothetical protein